jgi:hypothetical protein
MLEHRICVRIDMYMSTRTLSIMTDCEHMRDKSTGNFSLFCDGLFLDYSNVFPLFLSVLMDEHNGLYHARLTLKFTGVDDETVSEEIEADITNTSVDKSGDVALSCNGNSHHLTVNQISGRQQYICI